MSDVEKVAQPSLVWLLTWLHDIGRHTEDHPVSWQITCSPEQARAAYSALSAARPDVWNAAIEAAAKAAREYRKPTRPKPTIEELEAILAQDPDPGIEITPDGEVRATGTHIGCDIADAILTLRRPAGEEG